MKERGGIVQSLQKGVESQLSSRASSLPVRSSIHSIHPRPRCYPNRTPNSTPTPTPTPTLILASREEIAETRLRRLDRLLVGCSRRIRRLAPSPCSAALGYSEVVYRLGRRDPHWRLAEHRRRPTVPVQRLHERRSGKACRWAGGTLLLELRWRVVQFRGAAGWHCAD